MLSPLHIRLLEEYEQTLSLLNSPLVSPLAKEVLVVLRDGLAKQMKEEEELATLMRTAN